MIFKDVTDSFLLLQKKIIQIKNCKFNQIRMKFWTGTDQVLDRKGRTLSRKDAKFQVDQCVM